MEQHLTDLKLRFFTEISHELRTPLTLISSPIEEVISQEKLSEKGLENMSVAKRNTERMLKLINKILDFRKIQNNKMKVFIEKTNISDRIDNIAESFIATAQKREIKFTVYNNVESGSLIYTDTDKIEKILFNLLSNAFKYTSEGKCITLAVNLNHGDLNISVEDEGKGILSSKLNRLFTRFETLNEYDPTISTGIGLSLVKELVHLMHGSISLNSRINEGTTFIVRFPVGMDAFAEDKNV